MELWHIIYKGVDGRQIFIDNQDRARFVHDLFEFNDTAPAEEHKRRVLPRDKNVGRATSHILERERIVDIHGWKLMGNHVHLILSERIEGGLSHFLRKMSGYGRYFNEIHKRRGTLLDRTKKIRVEKSAHFLYILHYVHLNGLDDFPGAQEWRERDAGTIRDIDGAFAHMLADKWSSIRDYCGQKNFPSILTKSVFEERSGGYEAELRAFMKNRTSEDFDSTVYE
ncbi:MAG: hypothetical protein WCW36_01465 [Candidatus Paceibacterota bacterium]